MLESVPHRHATFGCLWVVLCSLKHRHPVDSVLVSAHRLLLAERALAKALRGGTR